MCMEKKNTSLRLIPADLKKLKLWKLSPLKPTDPQLNQTATITFKFELQ